LAVNGGIRSERQQLLEGEFDHDPFSFGGKRT
jgi:hypothetical protein